MATAEDIVEQFGSVGAEKLELGVHLTPFATVFGLSVFEISECLPRAKCAGVQLLLIEIIGVVTKMGILDVSI